MWMMGCSDAGGLNTSDSFTGRKLRPLVPRPTNPITSSSSTSNILPTPSTTSASCLNRVHGNDLFALRNQIGGSAAEQGKRELVTQPVSSRWNPTPEQLRTLEDLYRRGTRTPTAEQIQHITAQLRRFGKIEGKNVFYWFQNHKARERQKRRRRIEAAADSDQAEAPDPERKDSAAGFQAADQVMITKGWSPPASSSHVLLEESASISRAAPESSRTDQGHWVLHTEADDHILHPQYCPHERLNNNMSTWRTGPVHIPSPPTSYVINGAGAVYTTGTTTTASTLSTATTVRRIIDEERGDAQTLQLFPLHSERCLAEKRPSSGGPGAIPANFGSFQFFQFLPLKQ